MGEITYPGEAGKPLVSTPATAAARARATRKAKPAPPKVSPVEAAVIKVSTVIAVWLGY